jgi:hypothetical protein
VQRKKNTFALVWPLGFTAKALAKHCCYCSVVTVFSEFGPRLSIEDRFLVVLPIQIEAKDQVLFTIEHREK